MPKGGNEASEMGNADLVPAYGDALRTVSIACIGGVIDDADAYDVGGHEVRPYTRCTSLRTSPQARCRNA